LIPISIAEVPLAIEKLTSNGDRAFRGVNPEKAHCKASNLSMNAGVKFPFYNYEIP
jgi:hypothetical protein